MPDTDGELSEKDLQRLKILSRAGLKAVAWEEGEDLQTSGDMAFCSLHHHTTFSYLDGFGTPAQHALRAAELGMYGLAVTDHGNVTAHVQHEQACDKHGVKPLFGCEFYCGDIGDLAQQKKNHLTVLAEDQNGYGNLLALVSEAWAKGYYYQPTINGQLLREHLGGLVVLSGCQGSLLSTSLVGGKNIDEADASYSRAKMVASRFKRLLGDAYYLEVQAFPELEKTRGINAGLARLSRDLRIPLVATLDAHYTRPDEGQMQAILHSVRSGGRQSAEELDQSWGYTGDKQVPLCPLTDRDVYRRLIRTGLSKQQAAQAVRNSHEIAERCNVRLPKVANLKYPLPPGVPDNVTLFRRWINGGWKYRKFHRLTSEQRREYTARTKYEMDLIQEKGLIDYFLVMADATQYAKNHQIPVGPARGSAAASLVCYLLRITEVNPMDFPVLVLERFIDRNRIDYPDIDLDFDDERRHEVREYLVEKYGADRVGNIGTFTKYKGKNSLNDVQLALYRDNWEVKSAIEEVKGLLIERKSGDLRPNATVEDTIEMFPAVAKVFERYPELIRATDLEGNVRGMSVHAAGIVVANAPLTEFCAIYTKADSKGRIKVDPETGDPQQVISLDKYDVEYLGALKLDLLGLKTMAMIRICLEQIGMTLEELYALPLQDHDTLKGFQEGDCTGVFQFDGRATRQVNAGVKPDTFMEVADINALSRPGPLHSGATGEYIDVKFKRKPPVHYHEIVDRITQHTKFQIVYQEQILQICRELGDFSWLEAARVRRIISKKRGEQEFNTMRHKFVEGAAEHDMTEPDATRVWSLMATAGAYAFNAAHCVSYGLLAYWTMWLKRHHPQAFYVASLRKFPDRVIPLLRDALRHGIHYVSIDTNSQKTWTVSEDGGSIQAGWLQVPNIGEKTATNIMEWISELDEAPISWNSFQEVKGIGPKTVEQLREFSELDDPFGIHHLKNKLDRIKEILNGGLRVKNEDERFTQISPIGHWYRLPVPTHQCEDIPYEKTEKDVEVIWIGVVMYRNLKDLFEVHHSKTGEVLDPNDVKDPHLNEWVTMEGQDETGSVHLSVNRWRYPKWKEDIWSIDLETDTILVRGVKWRGISRRMISITHLWVLED